MADLNISLSDEQIAQLRALAQVRGQTPEQVAELLLKGALPPLNHAESETQPSGIPRFLSALDLSGFLDDPTISPLTSEEIDRLLAGEAINPHDEQ